MSREDEDTQVTRAISPAVRRASSSVIPRVAAIPELPEGPEQEAALAEVFGAAMDLITGSAKELVAKNVRLEGELANAQQEVELLRTERDRYREENRRLRDALQAIRGGR